MKNVLESRKTIINKVKRQHDTCRNLLSPFADGTDNITKELHKNNLPIWNSSVIPVG
jgi:hypothetical protein